MKNNQIFVKLLKGEKERLKQLTITKTKINKTTQQKLQQYFTNDTLATAMINYSKLPNDQNYNEIFEPIAGNRNRFSS